MKNPNVKQRLYKLEDGNGNRIPLQVIFKNGKISLNLGQLRKGVYNLLYTEGSKEGKQRLVIG